MRVESKGDSFNRENSVSFYGDLTGGKYPESHPSGYTMVGLATCGESGATASALLESKENAGSCIVRQFKKDILKLSSKLYRYFSPDGEIVLNDSNTAEELVKNRLAVDVSRPYRKKGGGVSLNNIAMSQLQSMTRVFMLGSGLAATGCFWSMAWKYAEVVLNSKPRGYLNGESAYERLGVPERTQS